MSSPAEPSSDTPTPASQVTRPLRELAAIVLVGANAVLLFVGLIRLLTPQGAYSTVTGRAGSAFFAFIGLEAVVLPVLAVLLATHVAPVVPRAKLITQVALVEYAVSAVLGGLTLLVWTVGRLAEAQIFDALTGLLTRAAWGALFGLAGYVVFSIWRRLYHVPRPQQEPGVYGTPHPGWPGTPGQPGYSGAPGQPGYPTAPGQAGYSGFGQPGYPGGSGQPAHGGSGQSGYPSGNWSAGDPTGGAGVRQDGGESTGWPTPPPSTPESSASPHTWPPHGQPAVPPQSPSAPPFGQPPSADPTQVVPRQGADSVDSTQVVAQQHADSAESTQVVPRQGTDPTDPTQAIPR